LLLLNVEIVTEWKCSSRENKKKTKEIQKNSFSLIIYFYNFITHFWRTTMTANGEDVNCFEKRFFFLLYFLSFSDKSKSENVFFFVIFSGMSCLSFRFFFVVLKWEWRFEWDTIGSVFCCDFKASSRLKFSFYSDNLCSTQWKTQEGSKKIWKIFLYSNSICLCFEIMI
jgi:hypothetical protein